MSGIAKPLIFPNPAKGSGPAVNIDTIQVVSTSANVNQATDLENSTGFQIVFSYSESNLDSPMNIWNYALEADRDAAYADILAQAGLQMD